MKLSGWDFIDHMLNDCDDILKVRSIVSSELDFVNQRILHKSVLYSLLNLGELMKTFTQQEKESVPQIPWTAIIGFRDRAAHGYHNLRLSTAYDVMVNHIPALRDILQQQKEQGKLKRIIPCRNCGKEGIVSRRNERCIINCPCGRTFIGEAEDTQSEVIRKWNQRN